jgi:hypothetical protein
VQVVVVIAILAFAGARLAHVWDDFRAAAHDLHPAWSWIVASCVMVLLMYALLIQTWRALVGGWGARLSFWSAARIWSISNLGRYVPGKVWQIGAMGVMAQREGVSPVIAAGSAVLNTIINLGAGFAIVLVTGARLLSALNPLYVPISIAATVAVLAGVAALPWMLPWIAELYRRVTGRSVIIPPIRPVLLWSAVFGNLLAWVMYGIAFEWLTHALVPSATGGAGDYIAVFTGSYLIGYLVLLAPAGIGARELAMQASLVQIGLTQPGPAALIVVASRLWLTVLEVLPGVIFLARDALARHSSSVPPQTDGTTQDR